MKKLLFFSLALMLTAASGAWTAGAWASTLSSPAFINVANDAGVKYDLDGAAFSGPNNTYYIKFSGGGGLNSEFITATSTGSPSLTTITTSSPSVSGSFYPSYGGGVGYQDDLILLVGVQGPIDNNFSLTITSSGYTGSLGSSKTYQDNVMTETFYKSDFIYGPQTTKPGKTNLNLYPGQPSGEPAEYLMFIDLNVGILGTNGNPGHDKVDYSFTNLYGTATFNMYGWNYISPQGQGINWSNDTNTGDSYASGYVIYDTATPVPVPGAIFLLASGIAGILGIRRRFQS